LLDIGNSALKWAPEQPVGEALQMHSHLWRGREIGPLLDEIWGQQTAPEAIIACNVAGKDTQQAVSDWTQQHWGLQPEWLRARRSAAGVTNAYQRPQQLGIDRWSALVATHAITQGPACIIDCGSAVTVDVIQANGKHLGGLILPGIVMMRQALLSDTAMMPGEQQGENTPLFATNTNDAINGGCTYAVIATLDRIYRDVETELGSGVQRIITGGQAPALMPLLQGEVQYIPDLVLRGLAVLATQTKGNKAK
jgi:type III pantothenate kinase